MIIGIDASKLICTAKTGVEISTSELITALLRIDRANTYWLYSPVPLDAEFLAYSNVRNVVVPGKRWWTLLALSRELRKNPPEVFWSPSNFLPFNLPPKVVATVHDLAFHLFPESYALKSRLLSTWTVRRAARVADKLIAVSRQTKKDLKRYFNVPGENIEVIYHALRSDFSGSDFNFSKTYPILDKYFIYVGRLELRKNLLNIITAFHKFLALTSAPVKLLLGGSPGYGYGRIQKLIKRLKLENQVIITNYLPAQHLPALCRRSLGVVFTSRYEGFGLNILEGFAAGVPVVTSNFGAMEEIAGKAALLVNPFNPDEIANGLSRLYRDEGLRQQLIARGQERLKDFSWEVSARKLMELWQEL
ncbi:hypothetical protein A2V68_02870 [candidate division Kazan bacterium RBG_13_50_9]|uniref:Glycosyl transferase family 1 domain-containing protein n=1 Tax=candidate division Kazan bacterium RBG_13_50_9 TaxID=1798535 RepID=A0A1F4NT90_UNCK3|nr:MAG: hypothetical protein A2V68_02870 [candidate division Kazan bacterium RBG_13_50_9]